MFKYLLLTTLLVLTACSPNAPQQVEAPNTPQGEVTIQAAAVFTETTGTSGDYGQLLTTDAAVDKNFVVRNTGDTSETPTVTITGADASAFQRILQTGCTSPLSPSNTTGCRPRIRFAPAGKAIRTYSATLNVGSLQIPLSAEVVSSLGVAQYQFSYNSAAVTSVDFGQVSGTQTSTRLIYIKNIGTASGNLSSAVLPDGYSSSLNRCANKTLAPGAQCDITLVFSASGKVANTYPGTLTFDGASLSVTAEVLATGGGSSSTGGGVASYEAIVDSQTVTSVDYGTVSSGTVNKTIFFKNVGTVAGLLSTVQLSNGDFVFGSINRCVNKALAAGAQCDVIVSFNSSGKAPGTYTAQATFAGHVVNLSAIVPAPPAPVVSYSASVSSAVVTSIDYGSVTGTSSQTRVVTIRNTGNTTGAVSTANLSNTSFTLTSNLCQNKSLAPNISCTVSVVFSPSGKAPGTYSANLLFDNMTIPVSAVIPAPTIVYQSLYNSVDSTSVDFGSMETGSVSRTVFFKNVGDGTAPLSTAVLSNGDFSFSLNRCTNKALTINQTCDVVVVFNSSGKAPGTYSANLIFDTRTVALTAVVTAPPPPVITYQSLHNSVEITSLNFGLISSSSTLPSSNPTSAAKTIFFKNTGNGTGPLSTATLSNTDFTFAINRCANKALGVNQTCDVSVNFSGINKSAGTYTTVLTFDGKEVELSAIVETPPAPVITYQALHNSVEVSSLDYGTVSTTSSKTFFFKNTGNGPSPANSAMLSNGDFTFGINRCANKILNAGESCDVSVIFSATGKTAGTYTAQLAFADRTVSLSAVIAPPPPVVVEMIDDTLNIVSGQEINYGTFALSQNMSKTFYVKNTGTVVTGISSVVISNSADFSIVNQCVNKNLSPNQTCLFRVIFTATNKAPGEYTTELSFLDKSLTIKATVIPPTMYNLNIAKVGGIVTTPRATCDENCTTFTDQYVIGSVVTLAIATDVRFEFSSWAGDAAACGTSPICQVNMDADKNIQVNFIKRNLLVLKNKENYNISVSSGNSFLNGTSVSQDPQYVSTVGYYINEGTTIQLLRNNNISLSYSWVNDGSTCGSGLNCSITMDSNKTVAIETTNRPKITIKSPLNGSIILSPLPPGLDATSADFEVGYSSILAYYADIGTSVSLSLDPNDNYEINSWTEDSLSCGTNLSCGLIINQDTVVSATVKLNQYNLTLNSGTNGAISGANSGLYDYGTSLTLQAVADPNYEVDSWTGDAASCGSSATCPITINSNKNVGVSFKLQKFLLTLDTINNGSITGATTGLYTYNTVINLTATPAANYDFAGWTGDAATCGTNLNCNITMNSAKTVGANFTIQKFNVTINPPTEGGSISGGITGLYDYGTVLNLTAMPIVSHNFSGWTGDAASCGTNLNCAVTVNGSKNISANFSLKTFTVTITQPAAGGVIMGAASGQYNYGSSLVMNIIPESNYDFVGWTGDASSCGSGPLCNLTVTSNLNIGAGLTLKQYMLTINNPSNGSISGASSGMFVHNTVVALTAAPDVGYNFSGWTGDAASCGTNLNCNITMNSAKTVGANFTIQNFSLSVAVSGSGSVSSYNATNNYGTAISLTATPSSGHKFSNWAGGPCDLSTNAVCSFTVTANNSFSAVFALDCPSNQHEEGGVCVANTRTCSVPNGSGSQNWASGSWGTCLATSCNYSYVLNSGSCIYTEPYKLASYNIAYISGPGGGGASYTCAYKADGFNCWGASNNRGYANGSAPYSTVPVNVEMAGTLAGKTFIDIKSGTNHACGLTNDKQIYCWGMNDVSQLGGATSAPYSAIPLPINNTAFASKTVESIEVGARSACAVMTDKTAYCWGAGLYGLLGNGASSNNSIPAQFQMLGALAGKTINKLYMGGNYVTCVVANDGLPYCVGGGGFGTLGNNGTSNSTTPVAVVTSGVLAGKTITSMSVSDYTVCAIASDNRAYCWGYGGQGQLGNSSSANSSVPVAVTTTGVLSGKNILKITTGDNHSCVIASDNRAYCWGLNNNPTYQLGTSSGGGGVPVAVQTTGVLNGKNLIDIQTNGNTTCVVDSTFKAHCWGGNDIGQRGDGTLTQTWNPSSVNVAGLFAGKNVAKISSGRTQTCAVTSLGEGFCWGSADYGNLGNSNYYSKLTIPSIGYMNGSLSGKTIKSVAFGYSHGCLIASDDQVYCWGDNSKGQIGNNSTGFAATPQAVVTSGALAGKFVKSLYVGYEVSCVIASDDRSYCWGAGAKGQLGNASGADSLVPSAVTTSGVLSGKTIKTMALGTQHTCVVASDDKPYCWGTGNYGQLGNNSTSTSYSPVAVLATGALNGKTVRKLYAGYDYSCVIASDDLAYCWGYNSNGQLGANDQNNKQVPVAVVTTGALAGKTVKDLALGYQHMCAIASDNKAYCWGTGYSNQIGTGTAGLFTTPQAVNTTGALSGKNLKKIYAGLQQSCVIDTDDLSYCWGQLGVGNSNGFSATPAATERPGTLAGKTFQDMYLGYKTSCAMMSDLNIYCFGRAVNDGEYGATSTTTYPLYKVQLPNNQ